MPDLTQVAIGQPVELDVTVTVAGTPTDPTAGRDFKVRKPDGTILDLGAGTAAGGSTGRASVIYDAPDQEGDYWWSFTATSPKTYEEHLFVALESKVTATAGLSNEALTTVTHARAWVRRALGSSAFDPELAEILINSYSHAIIRYCERQFRPLETGAPKTLNYKGGGFLSLAPYDLRTLTSITAGGVGVSDGAINAADYLLMPQGRNSEGTYSYITVRDSALVWPTLGPLHFTVTGDWGISTIPADVEQACLIAVANGFRNPEGSATRTVGELTYEEVAEAPEAAGRSLPADARALLSPYRRWRL